MHSLSGRECTDIEFDGFLKKLIFRECFAAFCKFLRKILAAMLVRKDFLNSKSASDFKGKPLKNAAILNKNHFFPDEK